MREKLKNFGMKSIEFLLVFIMLFGDAASVAMAATDGQYASYSREQEGSGESEIQGGSEAEEGAVEGDSDGDGIKDPVWTKSNSIRLDIEQLPFTEQGQEATVTAIYSVLVSDAEAKPDGEDENGNPVFSDKVLQRYIDSLGLTNGIISWSVDKADSLVLSEPETQIVEGQLSDDGLTRLLVLSSVKARWQGTESYSDPVHFSVQAGEYKAEKPSSTTKTRQHTTRKRRLSSISFSPVRTATQLPQQSSTARKPS